MSDGEYRDETRIAHMLEALSRLSAEVLEIKDVGDLSLADRLTRAVMTLPQPPALPSNITDFE